MGSRQPATPPRPSPLGALRCRAPRAASWNRSRSPPPRGDSEPATITPSSTSRACGNNAGESQRIFHVADSPEEPFLGAGFSILMNCNGNFAPGCGPGPTVAARHISVTQVDVAPPTLTAPQGSLLAGGVLRGRRTLSVDAADVGGGLSEVAVTVNGLRPGNLSSPTAISPGWTTAATRESSPSRRRPARRSSMGAGPLTPLRILSATAPMQCRFVRRISRP